MGNPVDNTPYDDVYRTLVNDCTELIIPVVNEMFHESYTGKEKILSLHDIHMLNQQDGNTKEKITDSCFEIQSDKNKKYHIECQSTPDGSISIRFFEYDSQIALDEGELDNHKLTVSFPYSGVLYLRHTSKTPDSLTIEINTPGGSITYGIPIMKVRNFSLLEIFEKKLLFLLPFYIFCYEDSLPEYEENKEKLEELKQEFRMIRKKLDMLCLNGELTEFTKCTVIDMMKRVISNIASKYNSVREEVRNVMGGKVLEHEAKTILNTGRKIGWAEGKVEGKLEGKVEGRTEGEIKKSISQILTKMKKNYSVPKIAEDLEESQTYIQMIYDIITELGIDTESEIILSKVLLSMNKDTSM